MGVAADGRVHSAAVLPQAAHAHRLVLPVKGVILELGGQGLVGIVVLGGNEQPRCVPVDAVDDAGAQSAVDAGECVAAVMEQCAYQRPVRVPRGGVDHHAGLLEGGVPGRGR